MFIDICGNRYTKSNQNYEYICLERKLEMSTHDFCKETHKKKGKEEKGLLTKCNYLHHKLSDLN